MTTNEILLIDLSSIGYPIWHQAQSDPNANATSMQIIDRVRKLATNHPHAAICCDTGRSFRKDLSDDYKANRPEKDASMLHQFQLAKEQLAQDGFPLWGAPGFEADDIIATATAQALALDAAMTVLICSADKDLLQLVGPRVRVKSPASDTVYDEAGVIAKFNVQPGQMRDFLTLVGDASDNVKGARGIGTTKAGQILAKFRTLENLYREMAEVGAGGLGLPPAMAQTLQEFREQWPKTAQLITLRTDAPIPFEEVARERVEQAIAERGTVIEAVPEEDDDIAAAMQPLDTTPAPAPAATPLATPAPQAATVAPEPTTAAPKAVQAVPPPAQPVAAPRPVAAPEQGLARREAQVEVVQTDYERQLDPRSLPQAIALAKTMFASKMFAGYGNDAAVLSTVMLGRELGLPAIASLRQIHVIEGRHGLSAQLMVALVMRSGLAEYFHPVEVSDTSVTYETKRKGAPSSVKLTHTIEMARQAQLVKPNSNWEKVPTDMLVARCSSRLCRLVYPDIIGGLYTPEELREIAEGRAA